MTKAAAHSLSRLWPWLLLVLLWGVALLNYLDRQVIFSIFPLLQRDLQATSIQLGLTGSVFLLTYGLMSPFAGLAADKFGQGRIIVASLIIWSASSFLAAHAHSMTEMLWTRAAMGLSEAFYIPAALGLLIKVHEERFRSLASGIHQTGCYAGIIAGGTIGGMAEHSYSWRSIFAVLGLIGVLYSAVLWTVLQLHHSQQVSVSGTVRRVEVGVLLKSLGLRIYTVVFMAFSIATWMLYTWLPLYLYEHFHMNLVTAGFESTFWLQTASFAGAFIGGALSDRCARRFPAARIIVQASGLALACPFLFALSHTGSQVVVIVALISIGFGRGCFDANTAPILAHMLGPELCSSAYGILNCAGCIIAGLTTFMGGWMRQNMSFPLVFTGAGMALGGGVLCLVLLYRSAKSPILEPTCSAG
jgi:MFS transporter, Spinster family, sphingosine-1-phosphate transporter